MTSLQRRLVSALVLTRLDYCHAVQPRHWYRCRESLMRQHGSWLVWDLVITWPMLCTSCTGCRSHNASSIKFASLFISRSLVMWQTTSSICLHLMLVIHHGHHHDRQAAAISSWGGQDERLGAERSLSLHLASRIVFLRSWISCDQLLHSRDIWKLFFIFSSVYGASRASYMTV